MCLCVSVFSVPVCVFPDGCLFRVLHIYIHIQTYLYMHLSIDAFADCLCLLVCVCVGERFSTSCQHWGLFVPRVEVNVVEMETGMRHRPH